MGGVSKSTKTKSKRIRPKDPSPFIPIVRSGKASSRKRKGLAIRRSQTRACTLSVSRSYSKVSRLSQKNLEHARSGSVALKRNRSTAQSRHHPTDISSSKFQSIPEDILAKVSVSKRSRSRSSYQSSSRTSRSPNIVYRKSVEQQDSNLQATVQSVRPAPSKTHTKETSTLKVPVTVKQCTTASRAGRRTHDAKTLRPDKRASTPSSDIEGAPANIKAIQGDIELSPTRLASVTAQARNRKRQVAETTKSVTADAKDSSSRPYAHGNRSSVRDISLAFSVLAKPPCLMQSTVRPMIADSNAGSGTPHRSKGHDEWDNLEVWGLGRTSWRESVLANAKNNLHPDFDARPGPRLNPKPVPQRSARLKFSMYNAKRACSLAPSRNNTWTERRVSTRDTPSTSFNPATTNDRNKHK